MASLSALDGLSVVAASTRNCLSLPLDQVPRVDLTDFQHWARSVCRQGSRVVALLALPQPSGTSGHELLLVCAEDETSTLHLLRTRLEPDRELPSLTRDLPEIQGFERELWETAGIQLSGHPWGKPLRLHPGLTDTGRQDPLGTNEDFCQVAGAGIHEVAVGPVHAGIIEPGHFRFQCHGEEVLSLQIHLGYQHRGAESTLLGGSPNRRMAVAEAIAGDTSIGHSLAYCMAMESLSDTKVPLAAQSLRGIALELERLANHVGDLGALAGDVAYLPAASYFGRLRGNFLNLLLALSGNRFGKGLMRVGGVAFGVDRKMRDGFLAQLERDEKDLKAVTELMFDTPSVLSRFEQTGVVSQQTARDLGLVGPVARASGLARDTRTDHPAGIYSFCHVPVTVAGSGDVMARALVRWLEVQRSLTFVKEQLLELGEGPIRSEAQRTKRRHLVVSLVEGWRGEIAHLALTDDAGILCGYKVVDPSFHNWFGLSMALRNNEISDFPLCNKSFNLSYAGHDL